MVDQQAKPGERRPRNKADALTLRAAALARLESAEALDDGNAASAERKVVQGLQRIFREHGWDEGPL
jgi:hypothetical protein